MPFKPDEYWFVSFYKHDPSTDNRCIYFTQRRTRCLWSCQARDNDQAIKLHETIRGLPVEAIDIKLIKDYVLCNCCRSGNAQHRDRIEDVGLWEPLAERWLDEIRRHAAERRYSREVSSPPSTPASSYATTAYGTPTSSRMSSTSPISVRSSPGRPSFSPQPPGARILPLFSGVQPYNLRPRHFDISTSIAIPQRQTSEFRTHIAEPGPSDCVSSKIRDRLIDRDFETGSLYIFDRTASPGFVKIGWTATSVQRRLEDWSKCDYTPNLLFSTHHVPYAQRAETLTHYELIKEWRRERQCKAPHCGKSHKEWFETSREKAQEVLGDWARFMKLAEPYDSSGCLKDRWENVVTMVEKFGETVTVKKLLSYYERFSTKNEALSEQSTDVVRTAKIEEQVDDLSSIPNLEESDDGKEASARPASPLVEKPVSTKETPQLKKEDMSPEPTLLPSFAFPEKGNQLNSGALVKFEPSSPLPFTAYSSFEGALLSDLVKTEPLPKPQATCETKPSTKGAPLPATKDPFKFEFTSKSQSSFAAESSTGEVSPWRFENMFKVEPPTKAQSLFPTELPTNVKTDNLFTPKKSSRQPFSFTTRSVFPREQLLKSPASLESGTSAVKSAESRHSSIFKSPFTFGLLPKTEFIPSTKFSFATETPFSFEPSRQTSASFISGAPHKPEPLFKFKPLLDETKSAPADKEPLPEKTPSPPLPSHQPVGSQNTISVRVKELEPTTGTGKPSVTGVIAEPDTRSALILSSESNQSDHSTESSLKPEDKLASDLAALQVNETLNERDKAATPPSIKHDQYGAQEDEQENIKSVPVGNGEEEPEIKETKVESEDEGVTTEGKSETEEHGWDEEQTLVEVQAPALLEKVASDITDAICEKISAVRLDGLSNGLVEAKVVKTSASPAVKVIA